MATEKEKTIKTTSPLVEKTSEDICFVIMPFGGWFDDYYSSIYCPAIKGANLTPHRVDDLNRPSQIINDIWAYTQMSKLILADLSGRNPNVFYELGLSHGIAKPVILITESIDDVPFDLRALRVLEYNKNKPRWGDILQEKITSAIKEVMKSPLEAVLPTFLSVDKESKPDSISKDDKLLLEMRRDIELLRNQVARNSSRREFNSEYTDQDMNIARTIIATGVNNNMPDEVIMDNLARYNLPITWSKRQIMHARELYDKE